MLLSTEDLPPRFFLLILVDVLWLQAIDKYFEDWQKYESEP